MLPGFPPKVMRIQRNAMPANPRTRIKSHEAERFRGCRSNHFPSIDIQGVAKSRHLVGHANVHSAKSVLQELRRLRYARRADRMNLSNNLGVKMCGDFGGVWGDATHYLGYVVCPHLRIHLLNPPRGRGSQQLLLELETRFLKHRQ